MKTVTAVASPNIAFIKYWGDRDSNLHIPANGSLSMNLDGLYTRTQVTFDPSLTADRLTLDGQPINGPDLSRVSAFLERVRQISGVEQFANINSTNNFPTGTGIASSASAFAALSLAAATAAGLELDERQLSRLARTGSGSACRSVPGGFVEWQAGDCHENSYAFSIAPPEHWELTDCVTIVSQVRKTISSIEGHGLASTSPIQAARIKDTPNRLAQSRKAILALDFEAFSEIVEMDSNLMHAVMITSSPPLLYWEPATLAVMQAVQAWRKTGTPVCYTIDAGPNVHVLCPSSSAPQVTSQLLQIPGVKEVLAARPGGRAKLEF